MSKRRKIITQNILDSAGGTAINMLSAGTTAVTWTKTFVVEDADTCVISNKIDGTVLQSCDVVLVMEQSYELPTLEGSAHPTMVSTGVLSTPSAIATWIHQTISPLALPYARIKLTGQLLNSNSTVTMKFSKAVEDANYL